MLSPATFFGAWRVLNMGLSLYERHLKRKRGRLLAKRHKKEAAELGQWLAELAKEGAVPMESPPGLWSSAELQEIVGRHGEAFKKAIARAAVAARVKGESNDFARSGSSRGKGRSSGGRNQRERGGGKKDS